MGVLRCSRSGCENIMCDRYSFTHGYLCSDCFSELVSRGANVDIDEFMRSEPTQDDAVASFAKWSEEFRER